MPTSADATATRRTTPDPKPAFEIEVFRPGTFTPMKGAPITFTAEQLTEIAAAYDPSGSPAPVVIGHPTTDAPAYGWIKALRYDGERERLLATVDDLEPAFADAVAQKRYRKVSMSFHPPLGPSNPVAGLYYPRHLGFLGGAAPSVANLKPIELAGAEDEVTIAFGDAAFRDVEGLFRKMRDFMIETFGLEKANEVLPDYQLAWLGDAADRDAASSYAEPISDPLPAPEPTVTDKTTPATAADAGADFAAREAALDARQAEIDRRERDARSAENAAFAESLCADGRLLPILKDKVVAVLDAACADDGAAELSFSEGGKTVTAGLADTFKAILEAAPKVVAFGAADLGDAPDAVDPDDAAGLATRAVAFQAAQAAAGITVTTDAAVAHVLKGDAAKNVAKTAG